MGVQVTACMYDQYCLYQIIASNTSNSHLYPIESSGQLEDEKKSLCLLVAWLVIMRMVTR